VANYNTFIVTECKNRKSILTTSSARKALNGLIAGNRVDVWNGNVKRETIYSRNKSEMGKYVQIEKEYIRQKQKKAEERNSTRKYAR